MIALEQARQYMESLGMKAAVEVLDSRLDVAATKQMPYPDMLADLLGVEVSARRERYLTTKTRMAKLPFHRTLEQFDFEEGSRRRWSPARETVMGTVWSVSVDETDTVGAERLVWRSPGMPSLVLLELPPAC